MSMKVAQTADLTPQDLALLRMLAPELRRDLAEAVLSDDGIDLCVRVGGVCSFGAGVTWGTVESTRRGLAVYQQSDGSRSLVPWAAVRAVRDAAPAAALADLAAAVEHYAAGPRYRRFALPLHLRPESAECRAMAPDSLAAARAEVFDAWRRDFDVPFREYYDRASARLQAALTAVLAPPVEHEPADLLEMLTALEGAAA